MSELSTRLRRYEESLELVSRTRTTHSLAQRDRYRILFLDEFERGMVGPQVQTDIDSSTTWSGD